MKLLLLPLLTDDRIKEINYAPNNNLKLFESPISDYISSSSMFGLLFNAFIAFFKNKLSEQATPL